MNHHKQGNLIKNNLYSPFLRSDIEQSIPSRFESRVALYPDNPAVLTPHLEWTYAQLNSIANTIAASIVSVTDPGPAPVCLLIDQGADLVSAILGVLKSGKFYVPLEPSHPVSSHEQIINSSGAVLIITQSNYYGTAEKLFKNLKQILIIEKLLNKNHASNPAVKINPFDPAYIFFTSGTSGNPKGVIDSHRNVLHNIFRYTNALKVNPGDRLTMIQSATFSGTVSSLFSALLNGAAILPFDFRNEGFEKMAHWVKNLQATIYHSVPSIFRGLVATGTYFPDLRLVRLEGDKASSEDIKLLAGSFPPDCRIAHGLGATETGLSCQYFFEQGRYREGDEVPIGYPLPDMGIRIIDEHGTPVADGETGEIEISSEFLATGYWHDPLLTSERFIASPSDNKVRHFRSGDIGKMDTDNRVIYIGRKDLEYKINGQFIALNEVEKALLASGLFTSVFAMTRRDHADVPRLVAYVVLKEGSDTELSWVRSVLTDKLPENSIPTALVTMKSLPLTEHGKVNRKALPVPPVQQGTMGQAALSEDESAMVSLWEEILNVRPIGLKDNFFNMGGTSLSAALITSRLEHTSGKSISPATLLAAPTIEKFIELLRKNNTQLKSPDPLIALRSHGNKTPVFMVDWPDGVGWHYKQLVHLSGDDQPFYCITSSGMPYPWPADITIEDLACSVTERILAVQPSGPVRLAGNCFGGLVAFEAARQMQAKGIQVEQLLLLLVSPKEFLALLPQNEVRKFNRHLIRSNQRKRISEVAAQGIGALLAFMFYWIKKQYRTWRTGFMNKLRGHSLRTIKEATLHQKDKMVLAYQPVKNDIKTILFLTSEETKTYTSHPAKTWAGIAGMTEVVVLPGTNEEALNEPLVSLIAEQIKKKIN